MRTLCLDEMSIMRPSERKSAVLNHMIKPLNKYETEYNFQNAPAFEMSQVRKRLLERQQKALEDQISKEKADMAELEKVVGELSRFVEKVPLKLYLDDVTTEKLVSVLAQNNPTAYAKANGRQIADNRSDTDDYTWIGSTVSHMLSRPEYLGHTVNFKTYRKSYKQKKKLKNDPSEWQIFENTHEAIIDQEIYNIVQRIRDGRRRVTPMGEMPILSGMVFCADCGAKLYQVRYRGWTHEQEHMVCATYRKKGKEICSSHQIRNCVLEELLLDGIRSVSAFARDHEDEFVEMVTKKKRAEVDRSLRDGKRELEQAQTRIRKLDDIIQHLYEDNLEGKISDERFVKLSENYENEQKTLESRVSELRCLIASEQEANVNMGRFLDLVRKYTDIRELTAEVIREFVERIYVHQAERVNGKKVQRIRIVWNCIGEFTPPIPTQKRETAQPNLRLRRIFLDCEIPKLHPLMPGGYPFRMESDDILVFKTSQIPDEADQSIKDQPFL